MPIPGLSDIYELGEWLKKHYTGTKQSCIFIEPRDGGLIYVTGHPIGSTVTSPSGFVYPTDKFSTRN